MNYHHAVPCAIVGVERNIKLAHEVCKNEGPFYCLECNEQLVLKKGEIKRPHFAHHNNSNCKGESVYHLYAKKIIASHLHMLMFMEVCKTCRAIMHHTAQMEYTFTNHRAVEELACGSYKLDVGVVDESNRTVAAIEVFHTHAVDQLKYNTLVNNGVIVLEVIAIDVLTMYDAESFLLTYHIHKFCKECTEKRRIDDKEKNRKAFVKENRKCYKCLLWKSKDVVSQCTPPKAYPYHTAFICKACCICCTVCNTWVCKEVENEIESISPSSFRCTSCIKQANRKYNTNERKKDDVNTLFTYFRKKNEYSLKI